MNDSKISVRYAKALFESALDKKVLDQVRKDMDLVQQVCMVKEYETLLHSPVIKESKKLEATKLVLKDKVSELTIAMLTLVFKNNRESYVPAMARNYNDLYKKHKGIKAVVLTSASKLTAAVIKEIETAVQKSLDSTVELSSKVDENLIGGFLIRIEDQQYDASVASSLRKVKKQLLN